MSPAKNVSRFDAHFIPSNLRRLWNAIGSRRKMQLGGLLCLTLLASVAEIFSIGALVPLLGILSSPEKVLSNSLAKPFIEALKISTPKDLLVPVTILFCGATLAAATVRIFVAWVRIRLAFAIGADLSSEVFHRTLHQPYSVHLSRNSSEVIDVISSKVSTVVFGVLNPLLIIMSNGLMLGVILIALLQYQPIIVLVGFGGFGLIYLTIYSLSKIRLKANSQQIAESSTRRIKCVQEGLGAIRDILLESSQSVYHAAYRKSDVRLRTAQAENSLMSEVPRYAVEALGMCFIATLALNLAKEDDGIVAALPLVGGLAIAAQRLLPLLQQIYFGFANLRASHQSLSETLELLEQPLLERPVKSKDPEIRFVHSIQCAQLGFQYRSNSPWVLRDVNLTIPKGTRIGFIGTTGSGKSTFIDILMGLLQPSSGVLLVDGQPVTPVNSLSWQARIAHVPQSVYLSDASLAENIAFGVPRARIDMERVRNAAAQAQIADTIGKLSNGYNTLVGERGVRLSGGERQRVCIARALYRRAEVLVFDEATSALDTETEKALMQAIWSLGRGLTILIVAHRLATLENCDFVVEIESGGHMRIGSYEEVVKKKL